DVDGAVLAAAGVRHELGALERLGELVPRDRLVALVADATVMGIHGATAQTALGRRLAATYEIAPGEEAKRPYWVMHLCNQLRLARAGTVLALGGRARTQGSGVLAR